MSFWTPLYLNKLREKIKSSLSTVRYEVNSTWHTATINQITVSGTQVVLLVSVPAPEHSQNITGIRIYDIAGELAGEQSCSILHSGTQSLLLKFEFPLTEA